MCQNSMCQYQEKNGAKEREASLMQRYNLLRLPGPAIAINPAMRGRSSELPGAASSFVFRVRRK